MAREMYGGLAVCAARSHVRLHAGRPTHNLVIASESRAQERLICVVLWDAVCRGISRSESAIWSVS